MDIQTKKSVLSQLFKDAMKEPTERGRSLLHRLEKVERAGRYGKGHRLSSGGMKDIFIHDDEIIERQIALALPRGDKEDYEALGDFLHEAKITAKVAHPNIMPIYDVGINESGIPYYTMKLIEGENLGEILKKCRGGENSSANMSLYELLGIFKKVSEAVAYAHSKGVVHLDLKPENILVSNYGQVQLCDWGLAHELDKMDESREPKLSGSPGFISPEQISGQNIGAQSDVYSLGAVLYNILSLERPFAGCDLQDSLKNTILGQVPTMPTRHRQTSRALQVIVKTAMNVDLDQRYQSVNELIKDLEFYQNHLPTQAEKHRPFRRLILLIKRHRTASMLILLSLLIVSIISSSYRVQLQNEIHQRQEISKETISHYNRQSLNNIHKFEFARAKADASKALKNMDNEDSHWLMAHYYMSYRNLKEARVHAVKYKEARNRLILVIDKLIDLKNQQGDEFLLLLVKELYKSDLPVIARNLLWLRNAKYENLQEHLAFTQKALLASNPLLKNYQLKLVNGKIHFKASAGLENLGPLANLPVEKLELKNSYIHNIGALHGIKSLRHLNLDNTQVMHISLEGMTLDYLNLSNTNINSFKTIRNCRVKHLVFKGTKAFHFVLLTKATHLEKLEIDEWRYVLPREKKYIADLKKTRHHCTVKL